MNATKSAAIAMAAVALLLSACGGGSASAPESTASDEEWPETMTSIKLRNGTTVSLQVASGGAEKTLSSRCWRLVESQANGSTAATSACHGQGQTAASKVFGAIVVVSECTNSPAASLHDALDGVTTRQLFDGMFLIPSTSIVEDAQTLTYSCINTAGQPGPPIEIKINQ